MNILKSYTSDRLLQLIFYSQKLERKEGTPYMQRRKISTGKNHPWNQSSEKVEERTSDKGEEGTLLNDLENPFIGTRIATSYGSFRTKLRLQPPKISNHHEFTKSNQAHTI